MKGPRGRPLAGATVRGEAIEAAPLGEGEYVFERLPGGLYRLEVSLPGYERKELETPVPRSDVFEILLQKGESISGVVRTTAGEPIPGARVRISSEEVRTDDRGRFRLEDLSCFGGCNMDALAEGFCIVYATVQGSEADIVLPRESILSGRVVTSSEGNPIVGAKVKRGWHGDEVVTDGSGAFTMKKIPPGLHEIHVEHDLYLPLVSGPWEIGEGEQIPEIELELESGLSVKGSVLSATTGEPVRGATVQVEKFPESKEASCDGSGSFQLSGLRAEEYVVSVSAEGFSDRTTRARVPATPDEQWTFTIEPEARIHGRVLDPDGKGVAGVRVHLSFREKRAPEFLGSSWEEYVLTDSRGAYELSGVPAHQDHCLVAGILQRLALAWVEGIAVEPGERKEVDIRFPRGGTVRGRVRTPRSSVPNDVTVTVARDLESPNPRAGGRYVSPSLVCELETVRPLPSGDFELERLPPGKYDVLVSSTCCRMQEFSVELEEGSERFLDIALDEGFSVAGKVVDAEGKPVEGIQLTVWLPGAHAFAISDEAGLFTASGLPAGRGAITAFEFDYETSVVCDIPSSGNVVRVGTAAFVSGRVEARGGKAAPECEIEFLRMIGGAPETVEYTRTDEASRFREALAPGKYFVRAKAEGFACPRLEIELRPGEKREILIELVRGGYVEARLDLEGEESGDGWLYLESPSSAPICEGAEFPGESTLEAVPPGPAALVAVVQDRGLVRKEGLLISAGQAVRVDLTVPRVQGIFGQVTRRGEPVEWREGGNTRAGRLALFADLIERLVPDRGARGGRPRDQCRGVAEDRSGHGRRGRLARHRSLRSSGLRHRAGRGQSGRPCSRRVDMPARCLGQLHPDER